MKIFVYCNGRVLDIFEPDSDYELPPLGSFINRHVYDPRNKIYSLSAYEVIGVSSNRVDLLPLFV